jgi:hypothetical protein
VWTQPPVTALEPGTAAASWSGRHRQDLSARHSGCQSRLQRGYLWLQPTKVAKRVKNRDHPDLRVHREDVDAEVERVVALGARHVDIGQTGAEPFVVLADPEGNEFSSCMTSR